MSPASVRETIRPPDYRQVAGGRVAWTTPALMRLGLYAIFGAGLLFAITGVAGVREHRYALQTIGRDSGPSIIAAQHIRASLANMDANAADHLLFKGDRSNAMMAFEARRSEAVDALIAAAENITYGDAEREPIRRIARGLSSYSSQVQQAFDYQKAADPSVLTAYHQAAETMDSKLLPAAADLDKANLDVLSAAYANQIRQSSAALVLLTLTTILVAVILIGLQVLLFERTRRILNPLLILATAIALISASYVGDRFRAADLDLKVAKQDAFDSIHNLWQARALAYSANADESRYLLDASQPDATSTSTFQAKAASVADGFLAAELQNITFAGEEQEAKRALARFNDYRRIDAEIRRLEDHGQRQSAIILCTGVGPAQFNGVLQSFDDALGRTLDINQREFDRAVNRGFQAISGLDVVAPIAALVVFAVAFLGLLPRLREYWE